MSFDDFNYKLIIHIILIWFIKKEIELKWMQKQGFVNIQMDAFMIQWNKF